MHGGDTLLRVNLDRVLVPRARVGGAAGCLKDQACRGSRGCGLRITLASASYVFSAPERSPSSARICASIARASKSRDQAAATWQQLFAVRRSPCGEREPRSQQRGARESGATSSARVLTRARPDDCRAPARDRRARRAGRSEAGYARERSVSSCAARATSPCAARAGQRQARSSVAPRATRRSAAAFASPHASLRARAAPSRRRPTALHAEFRQRVLRLARLPVARGNCSDDEERRCLAGSMSSAARAAANAASGCPSAARKRDFNARPSAVGPRFRARSSMFVSLVARPGVVFERRHTQPHSLPLRAVGRHG